VQEFKVIKLDYKRNNVVLSRKAVLEQVNTAEKAELLKNLEEGMVVKGIVKNITDYGAFVDLGGLDGLLHVTDLSWSRVVDPKEILKVGEEIDVKVLTFDKEKLRVSLGIKQIHNDPWEGIDAKYTVGGIYEANVSNLTDYGCFAELEEGIEGLIHLSELDWTNKNIHPSKVVAMDEKIKVMILEIDNDKRRISLGLKQTKPNPWTEFANKYNIGDNVTGNIKSVTDFGLFIGLEGDIDGLVHLSDIIEGDGEPTKEALDAYKKGDEINCLIFGIDAERERISLKLSE
jgi:small subunit ribosomal protein S1